MKLNFNFRKKTETQMMVGAEPFFIDKGKKIGVLLLHGFSSTPYQFRELAQYFSSKNISVSAPLTAGHGTTPSEMAKTGIKEWKESIKEAYLELAGKVEKIVIIGNSFGGNLAFYLGSLFSSDSHLAGIISLNTPIWLRYHRFIKFRVYTYGWFKKYYRKPQRYYKIDYTDMSDEITYPIIPIKSLRDFLYFIENETPKDLKSVAVPTLIAHANVDPVVDPKSASFIHENLSSRHKVVYWFDSNSHGVFSDRKRNELFEKAFKFIKEIC